ncbi:MAG TPA: hypothetical protein VIU39_15460 [Anaerolineales bacterium]|jgi:hypothetical protein
MKNLKPRTLEPEELNSLEADLAGTLRPVRPSQDVIARLRGRIHMPERRQIVMRLHDWRSLFLTLGGVLSGGLLVLTVARALFHLVGRRG